MSTLRKGTALAELGRILFAFYLSFSGYNPFDRSPLPPSR